MNKNILGHALAMTALVVFGSSAASSLRAADVNATGPVGSWLYTVTIPVDADPANNIVFQGLESYILGGVYVETDQLSFSPTLGLSTASHGSWATSSHLDFVMTYLNFTYDHTGTSTGMSRIRQIATLGSDGRTYSGNGDFAYYDPSGKVVFSGTFTITATKIQATAPSVFMDQIPMTQRMAALRKLKAGNN